MDRLNRLAWKGARKAGRAMVVVGSSRWGRESEKGGNYQPSIRGARATRMAETDGARPRSATVVEEQRGGKKKKKRRSN